MAATDSHYYPQLDGLRALAVGVVFLCHFWSGGKIAAVLGVGLFFVLSGFLITRILLEERHRAARLGTNCGTLLRQFYLRRSLRIFPVYYLALAVLLACNYCGCREIKYWLLTYTYTFRTALTNSGHGCEHFWSLCFEEQFYLVWPFIILYCPHRYLLRIMILVVARVARLEATCGPSDRTVVDRGSGAVNCRLLGYGGDSGLSHM